MEDLLEQVLMANLLILGATAQSVTLPFRPSA
jgi:hypothetical protein